MYKVSIIMPALNEEKNIDQALSNVISSFDRLNISGEIVVINDGSTDGTQAAVNRWMKERPYVRVIRHETPQGIGASFWDGVLSANGEIVTMMPGDGENDSYEILRYLPLMEQLDLVVPYVYNTEVRSGFRFLLSRAYTWIMNLSLGLEIHYYNGTALYRRSVLKDIKLTSSGFFYAAELLIKAIHRGYLYAEVPYALLARAGGTSKAVTLKSLIAVTRGYLSTLASVCLAGDPNGVLNPDSMTALRRRELSNPAALHGFCGSKEPKDTLTAHDSGG